MNALTVTIVGVGPRGLTVLDRLIEAYRWHSPSFRLVVHLVEPGDLGEGTHRSRQPRYFLTNTPASRLTIFPCRALPGASTRSIGLSLSEWATLRGYRRRGDDFVVSNNAADAPICDDDCVPRSMLGEYLRWFYNGLNEGLPDGVALVHSHLSAIDVRCEGGLAKAVTLETNHSLSTDYLIVTSGHGTSRDFAISSTYRTFVEDNQSINHGLDVVHAKDHARLSSICPDATVALRGCGLTAHDVIAHLTVGRGGSFFKDEHTTQYQRSGLEPKILLFSRSGLPHCARALSQKPPGALQGTYFFTTQAVAELRSRQVAAGGCGQLDYARDVLPLLIKEMSLVHGSVRSRCHIDHRNYIPAPEDLISIHSIFSPIRSSDFKDHVSYQCYLVEYLKRDLDEARCGNASSPLKAAIEVIRDTRQCFRAVVEHGGLIPGSHESFHRNHHPTLNRLAFGPPIPRNLELLALIEEGVVEFAGGPACTLEAVVDNAKFRILTNFGEEVHVRHADVLIEARIDSPQIDATASVLFRNLLASGTIRPYRNGDYVAGGIDIDRDNHPRTRSGGTIPNMWVFGHPVEGPNYFTNALPIPLLPSRHVSDADRCVTEIFDTFQRIHAPNNFDHAHREEVK